MNVEDTPFFGPLSKYCDTLIAGDGKFNDFPGTPNELAAETLRASEKTILATGETRRSLLGMLETKAAYVAIDRITIDLIRKVHASGDHSFWERIVELNYELLLRYCQKSLNSELKSFGGDAEDVVQVAFLKAHSKIAKFDATSYTSLHPWLQKMCRFWVLDQLKKRRINCIHIDDVVPGDRESSGYSFDPADTRHAGPVTAVSEQDRGKLVFSGLRQLTTRSKRIVNGIFEDRKSMPQLAKELGLTIHQIKHKFYKAMESLRKYLSGKV